VKEVLAKTPVLERHKYPIASFNAVILIVSY